MATCSTSHFGNVGLLVGTRLAVAAEYCDCRVSRNIGDSGCGSCGLEGGGEGSGKEEKLGPDEGGQRQLPGGRIEGNVEVFAERRGVVGVLDAHRQTVFGVCHGALEILCDIAVDELPPRETSEGIRDVLEREPSEAAEYALAVGRRRGEGGERGRKVERGGEGVKR